ncbi:hypothetical protein [Gordonia aichiensis]
MNSSEKTGRPCSEKSEPFYLLIFVIILIASVGDGIADRVGIANVVAYVLAPLGIVIILTRRIRSG